MTMTFNELRKASGMTQKEFSEYFGMSKRAVESWEGGTRNCPEYLLRLMEYKLTKEGKITCTQIP
jgi:DNA-binding transcriptional regulator YiaG